MSRIATPQSYSRALALGSLATVIAIAAALSFSATPGVAATKPSATANAPVTVTIPDLSPTQTATGTPAPSPTPTKTKPPTTPPPSPSASSTPTGTPTPNPDGSPTPPNEPTKGADKLKLDPKKLIADEWMIAKGTGYTPLEKVQLVLYPGPVIIGSFDADASGAFTARFRIPKDTRTGSHTAEATGWVSAQVANAKFKVVTAASAEVPFPWWPLPVVGVLLAGLLSFALYFKSTIAGWFARGMQPTGAAP